jgi:hypothetical protein
MIYVVALVSIPICRLMARLSIASGLTIVQLHSDATLIYFYLIIHYASHRL